MQFQAVEHKIKKQLATIYTDVDSHEFHLYIIYLFFLKNIGIDITNLEAIKEASRTIIDKHGDTHENITILQDIESLVDGYTKINKATQDVPVDLFGNTLTHEVKTTHDKAMEIVDILTLNATEDELGYVYEIMLNMTPKNDKTGEHYTPYSLAVALKVMVSHNNTVTSVYDPTCGSGRLLAPFLKEPHIEFFGQELNRTTYNLARMNMILHNVRYTNFDIKQDDTLERPQHLHKKFDAIVANPPFSANWSANSAIFNTDDRFAQYGTLAPKTKADYAFVQHMLFHLKDSGTMAVVLPHGVLFRGAAEGKIRQYIIERLNCLDAVIGLPANIFYGTTIPTCILVFKKCRKDTSVLFIDASNDFEKQKNSNALRPCDIEKMINAFTGREENEKYSRNVPLEEIRKNDFNLNIPRYINTFEAEERIDLEAVATEIQALKEKEKEIDKTIEAFCKELNIPLPL